MLRIPPDLVEAYDRLTPEQLSRIMAIALKTISPDSELGAAMPTLVRPVEPITNTVVRLQLYKRLIRLVFPEKRDDFRYVVKGQRYEWNQWCWQREIPKNVDLCDRAAEVVHLLLLKGFCVQVEHTEIRDKAIAANYEPEHFRLVDVVNSPPYDGWFVFKYPRSEDWYNRIMRITAAKYADSRVIVPPEHFDEVEDFAEQHDFHLTLSAQQSLENARAMWEAAIIIQPAKRKRKAKPENPLNNNSVAVPDSLKDDD